jgi:hypothetical protein
MNSLIGARRWVVGVGVAATLCWLWAIRAEAAGPPAKLTLTPMTAELPAGQTAPFTARLLDAAGMETTVEANSQVGFAVDVSSVAAVTIDATNPLIGNVMARRPGMTAVRAFYVRDGQQTTIFAAADLTVTAGVDGAVTTESDGGSGADSGTAAADGGAADVSVSSCPWTMCGGTCANLGEDRTNCGQCGHACLSDQLCLNGACLVSCPSGMVMCEGTCANLNTDGHNCGSCGTSCMSGDDCIHAACKKHNSGCALCGAPGAVPPLPLALFLGAVAATVRRRHRR